MKTLTLNYNKWTCGSGGCNDYDKEPLLGKGYSSLKNDQGFYCIFGLIIPQLNKNIKDEELLNVISPKDLNKNIPLLTRKINGKIKDTKFVGKIIEINDSRDTTPNQKIAIFRKLFKKAGYIIKIK